MNTLKRNTILPALLRIKDRHGHFLAEIVYDKSKGWVLRIFCRKCKELHEIELSKFQGVVCS